MQNNIGNRKRESLQAISKKDKTYRNLNEYLHNLKTIKSSVLSFDKIIKYAEIFDNCIIQEDLNVDLKDVKTKDRFINKLNLFKNNFFSNSKETTYNNQFALEMSDIGLNIVNCSVMSINIYPFIKKKKLFSKTFWTYIQYFLKKVHDNALMHGSYEYMCEWGLEEGMLNTDEITAEYDYKVFNKAIKGFLKKCKTPIKKPYKNNTEKEMFLTMEKIINHKYTDFRFFIDEEEHINCIDTDDMFDDDDDEFVNAYILDNVESYYRGNYHLTCHSTDEDYLSEFYISVINNEENEMIRHLNISRKSIYTKDKIIGEHEDIRLKLVSHLDNFVLINKLIDDYE